MPGDEIPERRLGSRYPILRLLSGRVQALASPSFFPFSEEIQPMTTHLGSEYRCSNGAFHTSIRPLPCPP